MKLPFLKSLLCAALTGAPTPAAPPAPAAPAAPVVRKVAVQAETGATVLAEKLSTALGSMQDVVVQSGASVNRPLAECGADDACLIKRARELGLDEAVVIGGKLIENQAWVVNTRVADARSGKTTHLETDFWNAKRPERDAMHLAMRVIAPEKLVGAVQIEGDPDGHVLIDGIDYGLRPFWEPLANLHEDDLHEVTVTGARGSLSTEVYVSYHKVSHLRPDWKKHKLVLAGETDFALVDARPAVRTAPIVLPAPAPAPAPVLSTPPIPPTVHASVAPAPAPAAPAPKAGHFEQRKVTPEPKKVASAEPAKVATAPAAHAAPAAGGLTAQAPAPSHALRNVGIAALVVGAAAAGGGAVAALQSRSASQDFAAHYQLAQLGNTDAANLAATDFQNYQRYGYAADALFVGAGATAVTGVALLIISGVTGRAPSADMPHPTASLTGSAPTLGLAGAF